MRKSYRALRELKFLLLDRSFRAHSGLEEFGANDNFCVVCL